MCLLGVRQQNKTLSVCQRCESWLFPPRSLKCKFRASLPAQCSRQSRSQRCRWEEPKFWEWQGRLGTAGTPTSSWGNTGLKWKHHCSRAPWIFIKVCVCFRNPFCWYFLSLWYTILWLLSMKCLLFLLYQLRESLLPQSPTLSQLWWKMCHGVHLHKFYMNLVSLLPIVMGKWWIKQVQISQWLLWGDPKIKASISLCIQMCRSLKLLVMLKYYYFLKENFKCMHMSTHIH